MSAPTVATPRSARLRSAAVAASVLGATGAAITIAAASWSERVRFIDTDGYWVLAYVAFLAAGAMITTRRPEHRVGWAFLGVGAIPLTSSGIDAVTLLTGASVASPAIAMLATVLTAVVTITMGALLPLVLLIFPTGHLLSTRWRWVRAGTIANGFIGGLAALLNGGFGGDVSDADAQSPLRNDFGGLGDLLSGIYFAVLFASLLAGGICLIVRYRRSSGDEREQLRWLAVAAALMILLIVLGSALTGSVQSDLEWMWAAGFSMIPIGAAIAVLKYRLYDIDIIISRGLVITALAAFISGVYVAIVVGLGALLGRGEEADPALSVVAVTIVAVAFQPIRRRLRRLADRLVYGDRATPYEVLAGFARATTATDADRDPLVEVARLVAAGTGASGVTVWLRVGDDLRPAASWPVELELTDEPDVGPDGAATDRTTEVFHGGELLGAISITKQRGDAVTPADEQLLSDVAAGLGLVLRNRRLVAELADRVDALAASRQRIVSTQDEVRRKFGRDLRAGAEERLEQCRTETRVLAAAAAASDAPRTAQLLDQIAIDTEATIAALRDFADGVYPPVLEAEGLGPALRLAIGSATLPVVVLAPVPNRYPREVEAAVYFTVLEAVQNASRYAHATAATVRLVDEGAALAFEVVDDGVGFDPESAARGTGLVNMSDRLDAIGGVLTLNSSTGHGTTVRGTVPLAVVARPA